MRLAQALVFTVLVVKLAANEPAKEVEKAEAPATTCVAGDGKQEKCTVQDTAKTENPIDGLELSAGFYCRAHPNKASLTVDSDIKYISTGAGEDSLFATKYSLGISDGVGSWRIKYPKSSAAKFSRELMHHAQKYVESSEDLTDPVKVLDHAYNETDKTIIGSATASVLTLSDDILYGANLGDSGFMVIRGDSIIDQSEDVSHRFNTPYQLGTKSPDKPSDSTITKTKVQVGDIVVMYTDGVSDNLFPKELSALARSSKSLSDRAKKVVITAMKMSRDGRDSPFTVAAKKAGKEGYNGGKLDDTCVIIAEVVEAGKGSITGSVHSKEKSDPDSEEGTIQLPDHIRKAIRKRRREADRRQRKRMKYKHFKERRAKRSARHTSNIINSSNSNFCNYTGNYTGKYTGITACLPVWLTNVLNSTFI